jgi:small-conductance mechanosensitive channel
MRQRTVHTLLIYLLTSLFFTSSQAVDALSSSLVSNPIAAPVVTPSVAQPLDLLNLNADWWKPFGTNDSNKQTPPLADGVVAQLTSLLSQQPPESQSDLSSSVENIQTSLKTLSAMLNKTVAIAEPAPALKASYNWQEFLQLMREMRKQQANVEQLTQDQAQSQLTQDAIARQADKVTALYLAAKTSDRFPLLLDMLEKRLVWLISRESLRLQTAQHLLAQNKAASALLAFNTAQERLKLQPEDEQSIVDELQKQTGLLDNAADALRTEQANVALVMGDGDLARARGISEQIALLDAQINEAQIKSSQQWLQIASTYLQSRTHVAFDWDAQVRSPLNDWKQQGTDLESKRQNWRVQLELKREKAQTAALLLTDSDASARDIQQARKRYIDAAHTVDDLLNDTQNLKSTLDDSRTLAHLLRNSLQDHDGILKSRWLDMAHTIRHSGSSMLALLDTSLFKIGETPVTTAGMIRVALIITFAWWFSYWLRKGVVRVATRRDKISLATAYTINRVMHYVIMFIGIMVALSSIGLDFSNVAWIAGALSVGIGFGLQSIVNNFVSGLIIMFERSLKVGDFIELQSGVTGTVAHINMRSTIVMTLDNIEIVVPNAEFMTGRVVNWTLSDQYRRIRIPFSVDYGTDKEAMVKLVLAAANKIPFTIHGHDREPQVWMTSMGDNGLEFELLVWIKHGSHIEYRLAGSNQSWKAAYLWEIESALREAGISVPYPQQDLYVRSFLGATNPQELMEMLRTTDIKSTAKTESP